MSRKVIVLLFIIGCAVSHLPAAEIASMEEAILLSQRLLEQQADSALCHFVADETVAFCNRAPQSPFAPEALYLASQLEIRSGHQDNAVALSTKLVSEYAKCPFAQSAFDFAWNALTDGGTNPVAGADLCFKMAVGLKADPRAITYYRQAFDVFLAANQWNKAGEVGQAYLNTLSGTQPDPLLFLSIAEAALKDGNTRLAVQSYSTFIAQYPNLPQVVAAKHQLGQINTAEGKNDLANEYYSQAWSAYQKNHKKSEYNQPEIARAAADALWTLQALPKRQFESQVAPDLPLTKDHRMRAAELVGAFKQVMITDPRFAAQCLNAIGDVHSHLGDALLGQGFRDALAQGSDPNRPPYANAVPEYAKASSSYLQAWEWAAGESGNSRIARYAAENAFDVGIGQGDAILGWAIELLARAPHQIPGSEGSTERFAYLRDVVTPILKDGLRYKSEALELTDHLPVAALAEPVRATLDLPVRTMTAELSRLCTIENKSIISESAQLASSSSMGYGAVSSTNISAVLTEKFNRAEKYAEAQSKIQNEFYTTLLHCRVPEPARAYWDSLLIASYTDYAEACRTMQTNLAVCLANLPTGSDEAAALRKPLTRLQAEGASQEYAGLVRWHEWASRFGVEHRLNDPLATRLAELDPAHFRFPDDLPSASRRKP